MKIFEVPRYAIVFNTLDDEQNYISYFLVKSRLPYTFPSPYTESSNTGLITKLPFFISISTVPSVE